jgi:hypothetical protein
MFSGVQPLRNKGAKSPLVLQEEAAMTMSPRDPYRRYSRGGASMMTWGIVIVIAILGIGAFMYAIAIDDRSEATKILNPPATSGSGIATTPPTTTTPAPPAGSGTQRP